MTDSYDCIVVGRDAAAFTAAMLLGQTKLKTLLVSPEQSAPLSGDLILPAGHEPLLRLQGSDRRFDCRSTLAPLLRLLDPLGKLLLELGGDSDSNAWELDLATLGQRLPGDAPQDGGVERHDLGRSLEIERRAPGRWQVTNLLPGGERRRYSAALVIDTRPACPAMPNWTEVWGHYQDVEPLPGDPTCVAIRPLDRNGWCSLARLGGGRRIVRAVFRAGSATEEQERGAELLEDRLVQCPYLLQHLLSAQLVGPLHVTFGRLADPWRIFAATTEVVQGQQLAQQAWEAFQAATVSSLQTSLRPRDDQQPFPGLAAPLEALFGPAVDEPSFWERRPNLAAKLLEALAERRPFKSPFPPKSGEVILTRV